MPLRLWNFACDKCGHRQDSVPITAAKIPATIKCSADGCAGRASWSIGGKVNGIHNSISSLYGRGVDPQYSYLEPDPDHPGQMRRRDVVVESYDHKKRLQRDVERYGGRIEEVSGPEKREDIENDAPLPALGNADDVAAFDADTDEEFMKGLNDQLQRHPQLDRRHTGDPRERDFASWVEIKE